MLSTTGSSRITEERDAKSVRVLVHMTNEKESIGMRASQVIDEMLLIKSKRYAPCEKTPTRLAYALFSSSGPFCSVITNESDLFAP